MNIATTIKNRTGNLLFKMMIAKQQTTSDLTRRYRYVNPEPCEITYVFLDNSSLTFDVDDTGSIRLTTGRG